MSNLIHRHGHCAAIPALLGCLLAAGCAGPAADPVPGPAASAEPDHAVLRVGLSQTAPPLAFERDGQPAGIEPDLARDLAAALGRELRFVPTYWPNLIPELRDRRIDIIMSGMTVTPERRRRVAFAEPYLVTGQQALVRRDDAAAPRSAAAVPGTRRAVAVEKGTTCEQYVREHLREAEIYALPTLHAAVRALVDGGVDLVVHDAPSARWMAAQYRDQGIVVVPGLLTQESLAWAVHPDDVELRASINQILSQWRSSGKLDALITGWLGR